MNEPSVLPGDPSELRLRIAYTDELGDTPQADTLEQWDVAILHDGAEVGAMRFFKVNLDRGMNAARAMEEESEELGEMAQALLDPSTGTLTEEAGAWLPYVGVGLLVMDRVTLNAAWRGHGLGAILATEAIHRLMGGCRAVACSPGVTDLSSDRLRSRSQFDEVNARIAQGWQRIGFRQFSGAVCLLSPTSLELEEQRGIMRGRLAALGLSWRIAQGHGLTP